MPNENSDNGHPKVTSEFPECGVSFNITNRRDYQSFVGESFYCSFRFWTKFLAVLRFSALNWPVFRFLIGPLAVLKQQECYANGNHFRNDKHTQYKFEPGSNLHKWFIMVNLCFTNLAVVLFLWTAPWPIIFTSFHRADKDGTYWPF